MIVRAGTWFVLMSSVSASAAAAGGGEPRPAALARQGGPAPGAFAARQGFYVDLHGAWAQLGGDFDGDTLLTGPSDSIAIPDASDGFGLGLAIGMRWEKQALELSFTDTEIDGSIPGLPGGGDVSYGVLDLDWRYFFRTEQRLQPFVQAGLGLALATLEDASTDGVRTGDADLSGVELGLGGGLEYYFTERWSVDFRLLYRYAEFDTAEGVAGDEGSLDDSLQGGGLALEFGTAFTL